jgi:odorant receptor
LQVAVDSLFFGCCLNICAHFDILRITSSISNKRDFIRYHQKILNLADDLNDLVKPVVFAQFLLSSLLLCVIGFQLVMGASVVKKIIALFFGLAIIIQLFVYSFGGQQIMDKSGLVATEIYQLDKDYNLVILRSKKPLKIQAGFYHACLPTFRAILSSAASLMTLLQSFVK